ncbi:hypothetical protein M2R47_09115 [Moraxella sp. Tifton1]|uniref:hypothetical protein n=1 Tax=Moraxella oculi TaxID=2940516 RepID=UPI0020117574|nr:hypothetical protein [Moraxella sp. Tifton1]MCL1624385.1 hypothetical protein [Moraxella sp. Tifton1]
MNNSKFFIVEGIDVYHYYDSDYYGMSAYIFCYKNQDGNFLLTLPGCYFEEILKMMSELINSNYCLLLEKFIDGGLDFNFDFQNNELGEWWEIPDKNLFLKNLEIISSLTISEYFKNYEEYDTNIIKTILSDLVSYLKNTKDEKVYLHYM